MISRHETGVPAGLYLGTNTLDGDVVVDFPKAVLVDTVVGRCHDPFGFFQALFNVKLIKQVTFLSHDYRKIRVAAESTQSKWPFAMTLPLGTTIIQWC